MSKFLVSCLLSLVLAVPAMGGDRVTLPGQGEVVLSETVKGGWTYGIERADDGKTPGVFLVKFFAKGQKEEMPPQARVELVIEQRDVQFRWTPNNATVPIPWQEAMGDLMSKSTMLAPVYAWLSQTDANRLTFAVSDAIYPTLFSGYERDRSGSKLHNAVTFFKRGGKLLKEYSALIRYDFRDRPYYETVSEACDWIASFPGQEGRRVPAAAYEPLWNSWYGYHIGFNTADIAREAAIAKDLGVTLIPQVNAFGHAALARQRGGNVYAQVICLVEGGCTWMETCGYACGLLGANRKYFCSNLCDGGTV